MYEIDNIDHYLSNEQSDIENHIFPNAKQFFENGHPQKFIFDLIYKFYQALIALVNNEPTITSLIGQMKNKILQLLENFELPAKGTTTYRKYEKAPESIETNQSDIKKKNNKSFL